MRLMIIFTMLSGISAQSKKEIKDDFLKACRICEQVITWTPKWVTKDTIKKCKIYLSGCQGLLNRFEGLAASGDFHAIHEDFHVQKPKVDLEKYQLVTRVLPVILLLIIWFLITFYIWSRRTNTAACSQNLL